MMRNRIAIERSSPDIFKRKARIIISGCSTWLMIATFAQLPVSTTHSITGATVGFGLIVKGTQGIHWWKIFNIGAFSRKSTNSEYYGDFYLHFLFTFKVSIQKIRSHI